MLKRACDACRQRKVKCDERVPSCTHCKLYSVACTHNMPRRRRGPKTRYTSLEHSTSAPSPENGTLPDAVLSENPPAPLLGIPATPNTTLSTTTSQHVPTPDNSAASPLASTSTRSHQPGSAYPTFAAHDALLAGIATHTAAPPRDYIEQCINTSMDASFAISPMWHELNLRSQATLTPPPPLYNAADRPITAAMIKEARAYCLTTTFCAVVSQVSPVETIPQGKALAGLFAQAAESVISQYSVHEIEWPSSDSISLRYWLSAYHHLVGNMAISRHYRDQTMSLVHQMRLWDERSYEGLDPIEGKLRRIIFWHCFISDKSTSLLHRRVQQLDELYLQEPITTSLDTLTPTPPLVDPKRTGQQGICEEFVLQGFKKAVEIWSLGSSTLSELRLFVAANTRTATTMSDTQQRSLLESYMRFASVRDSMPLCIVSPGTVCMPGQEHGEEHQRRGLWSQRANILLTYRFLHLVILCQFAAVGYTRLLGVGEDGTVLAWRKIEIAHEVLEEINSLPFEALQFNGEPAVEKLRYICAILLEVIQGHEIDLVVERARRHFTALLDILSRLDSNVSARLAERYT